GRRVLAPAERAAALITADWPLKQGRDVFCVPGSIESPLSRGCHRLIKQGAKLVEEPADILEEIPLFASLVEPRVPLTPLERAVLRRLSSRPSGAESLTAVTRLPACSVEHALDTLLTKGVVSLDAGGLYRLAEPITAGK